MLLYLDTSALLRAEVERDLTLRKALGSATRLFTCRLTHVEAARALRRLKREQGRVTPAMRAAEQGVAVTLASCLVAQLDEVLLARAGMEFPVEPVRSLDAIHLAAALWWREQLPGAPGVALAVASTDERLRANAAALGFPLVPATV